MAKISYTAHLKLRLKIRKIPEDYPRKIYKNPEQMFFDVSEETKISIKKLFYNNKVRNMMIAYEEKSGNVEIITIHPVTEEKIINRIMKRRWVKDG
ncbi:MAG: hypothetical protein HYY37_03320 [Candidatus Aenigmarchaeota archaeon]|nr:hypothetical protein [Candidatus Aenigmarchaeota archaeon]